MRSDEIDRLLDQALLDYSSAEPRPGLEQRVLNRVRAERRVPRFAFPRWGLLAAALAAVFLVAVALQVRRFSAPPMPAPVRAAVVPQPAAPAAAPVVRVMAKRHSRPSRPPLPKQRQFPAPATVTNEERALLAFVAHAPEAARDMALAAQKNIEPILIEQIEVRPLQADATQ